MHCMENLTGGTATRQIVNLVSLYSACSVFRIHVQGVAFFAVGNYNAAVSQAIQLYNMPGDTIHIGVAYGVITQD